MLIYLKYVLILYRIVHIRIYILKNTQKYVIISLKLADFCKKSSDNFNCGIFKLYYNGKANHFINIELKNEGGYK